NSASGSSAMTQAPATQLRPSAQDPGSHAGKHRPRSGSLAPHWALLAPSSAVLHTAPSSESQSRSSLHPREQAPHRHVPPLAQSLSSTQVTSQFELLPVFGEASS